jgi:hypoxanthine phosphoribosyltransferase
MARIQHGEILVSEDVIQAGIEKVATNLYEELRDADPLYVGMLNGGFMFTTLIMRELVKIDPLLNPELDFMRIGSYGLGTESGEPRIFADLSESTVVDGRHVVPMDDLWDTRKTMRLGIQHFRNLGASGVTLALLAERETDEKAVIKLEQLDDGRDINVHVAVTIPSDAFVIGLGLNGPKGGRVLPYIAEHGN